MIDLTPLDVRKKRGDFERRFRGYDPSEVETFLDLVAERLEELVKENLTLRERVARLDEQVSSQQGRENAVQEALVTAQELRDQVRTQAQRESELVLKEAEGEARRKIRTADRLVEERRGALEELERKRLRFLGRFRALLERELDVVAVEEERAPIDVEVELDLGGGRSGTGPTDAASDRSDTPDGAEADGPVPETPFPDRDDRPDPDAEVHELAASVSGETPESDGDDATNDDLWLSIIDEEDLDERQP